MQKGENNWSHDEWSHLLRLPALSRCFVFIFFHFAFVSKYNSDNLLWFHCKRMNLNIRKYLRQLCWQCSRHSHNTAIFDGSKDEKNFQVGIFDWNKIMNDGWMIGVSNECQYQSTYARAQSIVFVYIWRAECANTAHRACNERWSKWSNEIQHHLEMYLSY